MNRVLKTALVSVAVLATGAATLSAANARDWHGGGHRYYYRHHHSNGGDALAAGVVGLAAGALIGGALASQPPPPRYYEYDQPAYVVRRAPVRYYGGIEPWTRDWYEYCSDRYRSFNARTGTFTGYDGERHFCVAN